MKIYSLLLVVLMIGLLVVFTACGGKGNANDVENTEGIQTSDKIGETTSQDILVTNPEDTEEEPQTAVEDIAEKYPNGLEEDTQPYEENPDGSSDPDDTEEPAEPSQSTPDVTKPIPETTVIVTEAETPKNNGLEFPEISLD